VEQGTITLVYLLVGKTTQKLATLTPRDQLATVVGPLGNAMEIDHFGNVVCIGGCYGIASIYPIARALKEKGNQYNTDGVMNVAMIIGERLQDWASEDQLQKLAQEVRADLEVSDWRGEAGYAAVMKRLNKFIDKAS